MWERSRRPRSVGADREMRAPGPVLEMWQVLDTYSKSWLNGYQRSSRTDPLPRATALGLFQSSSKAASRRRAPGKPRAAAAAAQRPARRRRRKIPTIGRHALLRGRQPSPRSRTDLCLATTARHRDRRRLPAGPPPNSTGSSDTLSACASGRVGVSPLYSDLRALPKPSSWPASLLASTLPSVVSRSSTRFAGGAASAPLRS